MKYYAPSNGFIVSQDDMRIASFGLLAALKYIRRGADLPMEAYKIESQALQWHDLAQIQICESALKIGIDLGVNGDSHNYHKIDLREEI